MIALALLFAAQVQPQPVVIPIQNPSFEAVVNLSDSTSCGPYYAGPKSVPGWNAINWGSSSGIGILQPTCTAPADGKQILVLQNATATQVLGDVSKMPFADKNGGVDGTFTAHISVANGVYWYPGQFLASLTLFCQLGNTLCKQGTTEMLCSISGIGGGDFIDIPLVCRSQRQYGILSINLTASGYQTFWDNVSLTFTPVN